MTMTSASDTAPIAFVRHEMVQAEPPPPSMVGMQGWLKKNLFSTPGNILLTAVGFFLAAWLICYRRWK